MTHEQAVELAKRWIASKGCTLWMEWEVTSESGLQDAAEWMVKSMNELLDFHEAELEGEAGW